MRNEFVLGFMLMLTLGSVLAIEVHSNWEVPLNEEILIGIRGNLTEDVDQTCSAFLYKGLNYLGGVRDGSDGSAVDGMIDVDTTTVYAYGINDINLAYSTPIGYVVCLYTQKVAGDPVFEVTYGYATEPLVLSCGQVKPATAAGWQCYHIPEDDPANSTGSQWNASVPVYFSFRCFNCEAGVNEAKIGYYDSGSTTSFNSTDNGASWTQEADKDYAVYLDTYYNPSCNGMLVSEQRSLDEDPGLGTTLRGLWFTDLTRFQSKLKLDSSAVTIVKYTAESPFVVNEVGFYKILCGGEEATGVFKVIPSVRTGDKIYNLIVDVYANMGIIVVGAMFGVLLAFLLGLMLYLFSPLILGLLSLVV